MLAGRARHFYFYDPWDEGLLFNEITAPVKRRFIAAEHERSFVREMNSVTSEGIMAKCAGNPHTFWLEELVSRMHALQSTLPDAYCDYEIFKRQSEKFSTSGTASKV